MADLINLRLARKAKTRRDKEVAAAANRALHGRTKGERAAEARERARAGRSLDDIRRED
jgi:acetylornithine/succinyldiaminopimelate/putrescine aminotransferase